MSKHRKKIGILAKKFRSFSRIWDPFLTSGADVYAASACFFLLFSFFPTILLVLVLVPYFPISLQELMNWIETIVPEVFYPVLEYSVEAMKEHTSIAFVSISSVTALWAASRGILSIMDGLRAVLGMPKKSSYLARRFIAIFYFLLLILCLWGMLVIYGFGHYLYDIAMHWFPEKIKFFYEIYQFSYVYAVFLCAVLLTLIYWLFTSRKINLRWCLLGGVLTSGIWFLFSFGFSIYVEYFASYSSVYGAIGSLILACIWLYISILVLFYIGIYCYMRQNKTYSLSKIIKETWKIKKSES